MLVLSEKFEIRFSIQAEPGSPEFELLSYLKDSSRSLYPLKDMTMVALASVWLPLVYRNNEQVTPQQLHQVICDCTQRLMLQIQYFQGMDELVTQPMPQLETSKLSSQLTKPQVQPQLEASSLEYDPEEMFDN